VYDPTVLRSKTHEECEQYAKNVEAKHPSLAKQARRRGVELRAQKYGATTEAERDALQAIYALEEVRSQEAGRRRPASRTWQSIHKHGILPTVEGVVTRKTATLGYDALVEAGMEDLTFEAVVLRHREAFSPEAVAQSEARLRERDS
jgi:hypothetical protein